MTGATDYSGWLAAIFSGLVVLGGVIGFGLNRFRSALNALSETLTERIDAAREELAEKVAELAEHQEELELAQGETNRLAIRAAAQAETLVAIFGHSQPGGGRRSDPPSSWPAWGPRSGGPGGGS